jgi:hypothetical protein
MLLEQWKIIFSEFSWRYCEVAGLSPNISRWMRHPRHCPREFGQTEEFFASTASAKLPNFAEVYDCV